MRYRVDFFQPKEFLCPCCKHGKVSTLLVYSLDMLRRTWDGAIMVNSAWRCPKHNKEVGGVDTSRHMIGCAADIRPSNPELIAPFKALVSSMFGRLEGWELKLYDRFVHLAVPRDENINTWSGGLIILSTKNAL